MPASEIEVRGGSNAVAGGVFAMRTCDQNRLDHSGSEQTQSAHHECCKGALIKVAYVIQLYDAALKADTENETLQRQTKVLETTCSLLHTAQ